MSPARVKGEVLEEDGIVEIPAVGNGIDDWVDFEEAGTAIDADGFGWGGFGEAYPSGTWSDADAFGVGGGEETSGAVLDDDAGLVAAGRDLG